jgi:hypothetical protein
VQVSGINSRGGTSFASAGIGVHPAHRAWGRKREPGAKLRAGLHADTSVGVVGSSAAAAPNKRGPACSSPSRPDRTKEDFQLIWSIYHQDVLLFLPSDLSDLGMDSLLHQVPHSSSLLA